jgi:hypothetical protein
MAQAQRYDMTDTSYNHLDEIQDPVCRAKLKGIQESSYAMDEEIVAIRNAISEKRGVVKACDVIAARILQELNPLSKKIDDGEMEHDEAKIRSDQIKKLATVVSEIGDNNRNDYINLKGQIDGINRVSKLLEGKFNTEAAKYERQQRMLAEDDEEKAAPVPEPKPSQKGGKKVAKKVKAKGK